MAKVNPIFRAFGCSLAGNLPETMDKKTMLSIPKMISKKVRVTIANQAFGLVTNSIMVYVKF